MLLWRTCRNPYCADQKQAYANDRVDRVFADVPVDRLFTNLSWGASHDGRDRGIFGGVDLDPDGEVCGDAVGAQEAKESLATKGTKRANSCLCFLWLRS